MIRKLIAICTCLILCLGFSTVAFADVGETMVENQAITPWYIGTISHVEDLSLDKSTVNSMSLLRSKSRSSYDYVTVNVQLIRKSTDKSIKTWNETLYYNYTIGGFKFSSSYNVSVHDGYYTVTTYKCYKNSKLIETIKGQSDTVNY